VWVQKRIRTKVHAQTVLLVRLHRLASAKSVTLAKPLLLMAADARCVDTAPVPLSDQPMPHASSCFSLLSRVYVH
jgi:hypothetical protein